jgi:transposase-like protein
MRVTEGRRILQTISEQAIESDVRPGLTTTERERLKALERENRDLKRANDILRKASAFFAQAELDRRSK